MHQNMRNLFYVKKRNAAVVAVLTGQLESKQMYAMRRLVHNSEDENKETRESGDQPLDQVVADGERKNMASQDVINMKNDLNAKDIVQMTIAPRNESLSGLDTAMTRTENQGDKSISEATDPQNKVALDLIDASERKDKLDLTQVIPPNNSLTMESIVTEVLTQLTESSPVITANATKPSIRTEEPAVMSDTITNIGSISHMDGYMNQGNNSMIFIVLTGICCIFLFVWGRKRRLSATSSSGSSEGSSTKELKVQYTLVPDKQPFNHNEDADDEYCDDYEEDTFMNGRDNWDDWEEDSTQTQLNPFAAKPSTPRLKKLGQSSPIPYKLTQPQPPPLQHTVQVQESFVTVKDDVLLSSVESNSSSDSFEVVTDNVRTPPTSSHSAVADAERASKSDGDLFSQFGMVKTLKKSAVVSALPESTCAASVSQPAAAASSSMSSLPTAAEASALFAAEMDDELTGVDVADEWGEDDEWVKGI